MHKTGISIFKPKKKPHNPFHPHQHLHTPEPTEEENIDSTDIEQNPSLEEQRLLEEQRIAEQKRMADEQRETDAREIKSLTQQIQQIQTECMSIEQFICIASNEQEHLKQHLLGEKGPQAFAVYMQTLARHVHRHIATDSNQHTHPTNNPELQAKYKEVSLTQANMHALEQKKSKIEHENKQMASELNQIVVLKEQHLNDIVYNLPKKIAQAQVDYHTVQNNISQQKNTNDQLRHDISLKRGTAKRYQALTEHAKPFPNMEHWHEAGLSMRAPFHSIHTAFLRKTNFLKEAEQALDSLKKDYQLFIQENQQLQSEHSQVERDRKNAMTKIPEMISNILSAENQHVRLTTDIKRLIKENTQLKIDLNTTNALVIYNPDHGEEPVESSLLRSHEATFKYHLDSTLEQLSTVLAQRQNSLDKISTSVKRLTEQKVRLQQDKNAMSAELNRISVFKTHQQLLSENHLTLAALEKLNPLTAPSLYYATHTSFKNVPVIPGTTTSLPYLALQQNLDDVFTNAILYKGYPLSCPQFGEFNPLLLFYTKSNATELLVKIADKINTDMVQFLLDQTTVKQDINTLQDESANIIIWLLNHQKMNARQIQQLSEYISLHHESQSRPFSNLANAFCKSPECDFKSLEPKVRLALLKKMKLSSEVDAYPLIQWYTTGNNFYGDQLLTDMGIEHYAIWLKLSIEAAKQKRNMNVSQADLQTELKRVETFKAHHDLLQNTALTDVLTPLSQLDSLIPPIQFFEPRTPFKGIPIKEGALILPAQALIDNQEAVFVNAILKGYPLNYPPYGDLNPLLLLYKHANAAALLTHIKDTMNDKVVQFFIDQLKTNDLKQFTPSQAGLFNWLFENQKINSAHAAQLRTFIASNYTNKSPAFSLLVNAFFLKPIADFASLEPVVRNLLIQNQNIQVYSEDGQHQLAQWYVTNKNFCIHALFENFGEDYYIHCIRIAEIASANQHIEFQQPDPTTMNTVMRLHLDNKGLWGTSLSLINLITNKPQIFRTWFLSPDISQEYQLSLIRLCPDLFTEHPTPITEAYVSRAKGVYSNPDDNDIMLINFAKTSFAALTDAKDVLLLAHTFERFQWRTQHASNIMLKLAKNRILETIDTHQSAPQELLDFLDQRRPQSFLIYLIPKWLRFDTTSRVIYNGFFSNRAKAADQLRAVQTQTAVEVDALITPRI